MTLQPFSSAPEFHWPAIAGCSCDQQRDLFTSDLLHFFLHFFRHDDATNARECKRDGRQHPCRESAPSVSLPRRTRRANTLTSFIIRDDSAHSILRVMQRICATYRTGLQRRYKGKSGLNLDVHACPMRTLLRQMQRKGCRGPRDRGRFCGHG